MSLTIVTLDELDLEISLANIALASARGMFARCPSGENEGRVRQAMADLDALLDQRLAAAAA
jgi:hypothetical protein